jgi:group I intron endonuclease
MVERNKQLSPGVYKLDFPSGHFYIGSSGNVEKRYREHINSLKTNTHDSDKVQSIFNEFGDIPKCVLLTECEKEKIRFNEQKFLDENFDKEGCLNKARDATSPGKGNKWTEERKAYMSDLMKERIFTDEHRSRISASKKGVPGQPLTEERKTKIGLSLIGKKHTEESKEKISLALKGHKPGGAKPVVLINTGEIFESAMLAERTLNIQGIARACRKDYTAGKLPDGEKIKWKFL